MPLIMNCSRGARMQIGDFAGVSWERSNQDIRWTIDTTVVVRAGSIALQPSEHLVSIDVPLGHKIQVGPATIWVEYNKDTDHFGMRLECPRSLKLTPTKQPMYLATRTNGKMAAIRPVAPAPSENGHVVA